METLESGDYHARGSDNRMFWVAIIGPLLSFVLGVGTGSIGTMVLFRDHDKRIARLEADSAIYRDVVTALRVKGIIR